LLSRAVGTRHLVLASQYVLQMCESLSDGRVCDDKRGDDGITLEDNIRMLALFLTLPKAHVIFHVMRIAWTLPLLKGYYSRSNSRVMINIIVLLKDYRGCVILHICVYIKKVWLVLT